MRECWADIEEYYGLYEVSNLGNVRSLDKTIKTVGNYNVEYSRFYPGKQLALINHPTGYITVRLSHMGKAKTRRVHKLVALAFIDNIEDKLEINHKDKDRHNNCVSNLEWCTRQENEDHKHAKNNYS